MNCTEYSCFCANDYSFDLFIVVKIVLISLGLVSITDGYATALYAYSGSSLICKLFNPAQKGTLCPVMSEHSGTGKIFCDNR